MEDNLVTIQEPRGGQVSKQCSSIPPAQNNSNERMQIIVGAHEEGQPLEE